MTRIYYGKLSPDEFRAKLAESGIHTKPHVERAAFSGSGLYVNPTAENVIREYSVGEVDGIPYEMFVTPYVLPLKYKATMYAVVFAMELPYDTASVFIESKTQLNFNTLLGISALSGMAATERISLEGDFDTYFNVYAQDGHEVEAVTTLAPNMMMQLLESQADFDIEFAGNYVYLYKMLSPTYVYDTRNEAKTVLNIQSAYEQLHAFGTTSARQLARFARSTREVAPGRKALWEVLSANREENNRYQQKWLLYLVLIAFALIVFKISVLMVIVLYVAYRYWQWNRRRARLIDTWHRDPESIQIHARSGSSEANG